MTLSGKTIKGNIELNAENGKETHLEISCAQARVHLTPIAPGLHCSSWLFCKL